MCDTPGKTRTHFVVQPIFIATIIRAMGLLDWLKPTAPVAADLLPLIEKAVTSVDPLIRQVGGYERALAPTVERAFDYCQRVALAIPGPFSIDHAAFATDALMHALFGSADDIRRMLGASECVREHFAQTAAADLDCCYALLGMRLRIAAGFGARMDGELLRRDEPRKTLGFVGHTLSEPGIDLDTVHRRLAAALFDGLTQSFAEHVAEARTERRGLHDSVSIERALARGPSAALHTRRLADLQERLRASDDALQPKPLLAALADHLAVPENSLGIESAHLWVDRCGVIAADPDERARADALRFVQLRTRDRRRWVVMTVKIQRAEARAALEHIEAQRRYIVI